MQGASAGTEVVPESDDGVRVLHVDDDEAFTEVTARHLEGVDDSLSVESETAPERALERLSESSFDAVVSDYELPERDGLELLRAVRDRHGDLPFILFTDSGSETVASEAIAGEVTDYLRKGTGTEQCAVLANRIRHAVDAARQRERAGELKRVNRLIRRVNREVARADSATDIERAVCRTIAAADPYRFAWLGDRDPATDGVRIRATGGDAAEYLEAVPIRADDSPQGRGPAGRALRTGEVQLAQAIPSDPTFAPWHEIAAEYGFQSVIVLPLRGPEMDHGVLTIYADRQNAFDERERTILEELAETIGGALDGAAAQRRLQERGRELQRYGSIIEASGDPVYVIDAGGHFRFVNDRLQEMTGYCEETLLGEHVSMVLPPSDVEQGEALVRSLLKTDSDRRTYEMTIVTADGERITCENHVSLLPFEDRFRGTVGVVRDITDRVARERELERQNERLEEFASVVSHDLRNPLNVVQGSLEMAEHREDLDELERAHRGLDRMRTLVDDLLRLARAGEPVTEFDDVGLDVAAERAWAAVETGDAVLEVRTEQPVRADENRLQQLLENLFRNSVEHGSTNPASHAQRDSVEHGSAGDQPEADEAAEHGATDGQSVTVTVDVLTAATDASGRETTAFYVADDGRGIPAEHRDRVFDRGYSASDDGTGFGLRIVEECAQDHGWSVRLTEAECGGARFEFTGVDPVAD